MRIRARVVAAVTTAAMLTALTGCGSGSGASENSLKISGNSSEKAGLDAIVKDFKAANPGVSVATSYSADPQSTLPTQLSAGTAADVIWLNSGQQGPASVGGAAADGYLLDVSGEPWAKAQPSDSISKYKGKVWSASVVIAGIGIAWDATTLTNAGLTVPTTLTQLFAVCDAAKAKGLSALAVGYQDNWVTQMVPYALASTIVDRPHPDFQQKFSDGKVTLPDSDWVEVLNVTKRIATRPGCFSESPLGVDYNGAASMVSSHKALGMAMVSSVLPTLTAAAKDDTFTFSVLPANDDPGSFAMPQSYSGTFAINAKTKNTALAKKFMTFLTSTPEATKYANLTGGAPYLIDGSTPKAANPKVDISSISTFNQEKRTGPFGLLGLTTKGQGALLKALQDFQAGKLSAKEVLNQVQAANR